VLSLGGVVGDIRVEGLKDEELVGYVLDVG